MMPEFAMPSRSRLSPGEGVGDVEGGGVALVHAAAELFAACGRHEQRGQGQSSPDPGRRFSAMARFSR